ncbi:MAG: hypothetical protein IJT94_00140 [Oscillibacter sp.]|nr:hypothetical protein [Oscillibacter sp.]
MRKVLEINGHDYTKYVQWKGLSWSRDDLDSDDAERTMDGTMHRDKITEKRNLTYKILNAPEAVLAQLDDDLRAENSADHTFYATYRDLHGEQTRKFYCSSLKLDLYQVDEGNDADWGDGRFSIHEV